MLRAEPALSRTSPVHGVVFSPRRFHEKKPCYSVRSSDSVLSSRSAVKAVAAEEAAAPDPLYLFYCARKWHKSGDTAAGWELVQAMRSQSRGGTRIGG